jgi:hypothetical protein
MITVKSEGPPVMGSCGVTPQSEGAMQARGLPHVAWALVR